MASAPVDVPPFQIQPLLDRIVSSDGQGHSGRAQVSCAQALGSDIYVGCANGDIMRLGMKAAESGQVFPPKFTKDTPDTVQLESYQLLSRQNISANGGVEEIVLLPSISRALVLVEHQIHFFVLPSFDPLLNIKPIRNVVTLAVDNHHLTRPAPSIENPLPLMPVEFTVVKRQSLAMFSVRDNRLTYQKDIPLPSGASFAKRSGSTLCIADRENYCVVDLEKAVSIPLIPISQAMDPTPIPIAPHILVCPHNEYLVLSWTGTGTIGVFITDDGMPTRGTLQFDSHPDSICLDWPYVVALLPDNSIEVHSAETQTIIQRVPASEEVNERRLGLLHAVAGGYLVPSSESSTKLAKTSVKLLRSKATVVV